MKDVSCNVQGISGTPLVTYAKFCSKYSKLRESDGKLTNLYILSTEIPGESPTKRQMTEKDLYESSLKNNGGALLEHSLPKYRGRGMWCAPVGWKTDRQMIISSRNRKESCEYLIKKINERNSGLLPEGTNRCSDQAGRQADCVYKNDPALYYTVPADADAGKISVFCATAINFWKEKDAADKKRLLEKKAAPVANPKLDSISNP